MYCAVSDPSSPIQFAYYLLQPVILGLEPYLNASHFLLYTPLIYKICDKSLKLLLRWAYFRAYAHTVKVLFVKVLRALHVLADSHLKYTFLNVFVFA